MGAATDLISRSFIRINVERSEMKTVVILPGGNDIGFRIGNVTFADECEDRRQGLWGCEKFQEKIPHDGL
jgi:hypothetical protein